MSNPFENSVLILGAGASKGYDFPIGSELRDEIIKFESEFEQRFKKFDPESRISNFCNFLLNEKYDDDLVKRFVYNFKASGADSIDEYLQFSFEKNLKFHQLGLYLIYFFIENRETKHSLQKSDWIEKFVRYFMNTKYREQFLNNPPYVISFNYDTYFQNKIEYNLRENYGILNFSYRNIVHVYGSTTGNTYYQSGLDFQTDRFSRYREESKRISLIRNDIIETSETVQTIRNKIKNARKIFLLGYGFNRLNNKILFKNANSLRTLIRNEKIISSRVNIDPYLLKKFNELAPSKKFLKEEIDCKNLIDSLIPRDLF